MPVISATWESGAGESQVPGQPTLCRETLSQNKKSCGCISVVEGPCVQSQYRVWGGGGGSFRFNKCPACYIDYKMRIIYLTKLSLLFL